MLYNRVIEATIQKDNSELITFRDFHMAFDIKKVSSTDPNTCVFKIYNLSNTTFWTPDLKLKLIVKAGYIQGSGLEVIFIGDVDLVSTKREFPDKITTIEARDGELPLLTTRDSVSFGEGVSVKQILKSIISKFKVAVKGKIDELPDKKYANGFSFTGQLKELLEKLSKDTGFSWSFQNDELKFYKDTATDGSTIVINTETGLIGSPERIKIQSGKKTEKIEINGWKVASLLQPKAEPGGGILLSSEEVGDNKEFKIYSASHIGDNFEGDFQTTIEAVDYGR